MPLALGKRARRYAHQHSRAPRGLVLALCSLALSLTAANAQRSTQPTSPWEVRELGRLERPDMVPVILPLLKSDVPGVRAEAANALAQSLWQLARATRADSDSALVRHVARALRERLAIEREPMVMASIAASLGRLPYSSASERRSAEGALAALLERTSDPRVAIGAARGVESLTRSAGSAGSAGSADSGYALTDHSLDVLRSMVRGGSARWRDTSFAWPRRLAMMALISSGAVDTATLRDAATVADPQLRRLAALATRTLRDTIASRRMARALLMDGAPMVRIEAVASWSRIGGGECAPLVPMALDSAPQVSITVVDAIGSTCVARPGSEAESALVELILAGTGGAIANGGASGSARVAMHRAAHAIRALAHVSPSKAAALIGRVAGSPAWQARMYAARAAALLSDTATLMALQSDALPNVRSEAVTGLAHVVGHAADGSYIAALASNDYQLVLAAAQALRGTPRRAEAASALLGALARITAEKRETSRDPRVAIMVTLRAIDSSGLAESVMPYLADFDPVVADSAAAMITKWAGRVYASAPRPLPDVYLAPDDANSLRHARVRVTIADSSGGGSFELELLPDEAPATVSRFVQLVGEGYYDGLTIHRVVPDFVVQGGSPGANEYVGDGPFMRDEVGFRSHLRGALGISTRGRDTGDAQFFVDLVDNPRLDHDYTVFAAVVAGMDVVDQLLEGDVMQSVERIPGR